MKTSLSVLLLVGCCVCLAVAINTEAHRAEQFRRFVAKHNRPYKNSPEEYAFRQKVFFNKLDFIEDFNNQDASFKVGINEFADLTDEEFNAKIPSMDYSNTVYDYTTTSSSVAPPASLDWRTSKNPQVVGPVRSMGQCAASAAVSIVDSIAGDYALKTSSDFYEFNISYVSNCDGSKCSGATTDAVWNYVKKFGLQWYYNNDEECPSGPGVGICITGPTCIPAGNETALLNAVATKGPISIVIDASLSTFQAYASGIYYDPKCSSTKVNLPLLLVGYGSSNGQDYWIARNEWGTSWGMNGDVLIARNKNNLCGVASNACYATTAQNCMCEI